MSHLKQQILAKVASDLAEIETALQQNLNPHFDLVSQVAGHILFSGGKRLRPLLMVLGAKICGYQGTDDKTFSTVFEYLHAATLLHDDLVDEATVRRGQPVAHSIWGNPTAVLVGDFLLARSLSIAAQTGRPQVIQVIAEITENMSQGEIYQLSRKGQLDLSEKEYFEIIHRKTAVLIRGACRVGAMISDALDDEERALADYGYNLGIAFQMADDLLDYTSDSRVLGKTVGADLKEGKLTLPVIHALNAADSQNRDIMQSIIQRKVFCPHDFEAFTELLNRFGGIAYTKRLAAAHIQKAKTALSVFNSSEAKEILLNIADFALARKT